VLKGRRLWARLRCAEGHGSVAYLDAADVGYGLGLDPDGHRVEFIGSWAVLAPLGDKRIVLVGVAARRGEASLGRLREAA